MELQIGELLHVLMDLVFTSTLDGIWGSSPVLISTLGSSPNLQAASLALNGQQPRQQSFGQQPSHLQAASLSLSSGQQPTQPLVGQQPSHLQAASLT